jgi:hypothetical protein
MRTACRWMEATFIFMARASGLYEARKRRSKLDSKRQIRERDGFTSTHLHFGSPRRRRRQRRRRRRVLMCYKITAWLRCILMNKYKQESTSEHVFGLQYYYYIDSCSIRLDAQPPRGPSQCEPDCYTFSLCHGQLSPSPFGLLARRRRRAVRCCCCCLTKSDPLSHSLSAARMLKSIVWANRNLAAASTKGTSTHIITTAFLQL